MTVIYSELSSRNTLNCFKRLHLTQMFCIYSVTWILNVIVGLEILIKLNIIKKLFKYAINFSISKISFQKNSISPTKPILRSH